MEVLNTEEEGDKKEEAKDGGDTDRHQNANWRVPAGVIGLFREMGRGIKAGDSVLAHQNATDRNVCRGKADAPAIAGNARAVVEGGEYELGGLVRWGFGEDSDGEASHAN